MSAPTPEEAAAVIAAIEHHLAQTARRDGRAARSADRWTAAARLGDERTPSAWGAEHPWLK